MMHDRAFDDRPSFRFPSFRQVATGSIAWSPKIDVFEKDSRLDTRVDLPGMKKEDVSEKFDSKPRDGMCVAALTQLA